MKKTEFRVQGSGFRVFVLVLFYALSPIPCLYAAFEEITVGGRAAGLGGAYTALGDAYSIYYNPAGISAIARAEFGAQYSRLHLGLDDGSDLSNAFVGIAQPLKFKNDYGTIGLGWLRFALSGLYQENTIILSYGKDAVLDRLMVGLNAKFILLTYGEDAYTKNAMTNEGQPSGIKDTLFEKGNSKSAFDFDFGLKYPLAENYTIGAVVQNIVGANVSLVNAPDVTLSRRLKLGMSHTGKNYLLTCDIATDTRTNAIRGMLGGEKSFDFGGVLRGGLGIGSDGWANFTAGIGYKTDGLNFDYGLIWPMAGIKDTYGSHRVSLNFKFGPVIRLPEKESELQIRLAKETTTRRELEEKYKVSEIELTKAREEIKQLRNQIEELLKRPATAPPPREIPAPKVKDVPAVPSVPKKPAVKVEEIKPEPPTDTEQLKATYIKEYNQYQRDAAKLDIKKRLHIVENIIARYSGKIKITEALDEQMLLRNEFAAQTKFYNDAIAYYRRLVRQGISAEERRDILNRMMKKYDAMGVDVSAAREELKQVK